MKKILFIMVVCFLFGCGGGSSTNTNSGNEDEIVYDFSLETFIKSVENAGGIDTDEPKITYLSRMIDAPKNKNLKVVVFIDDVYFGFFFN